MKWRRQVVAPFLCQKVSLVWRAWIMVFFANDQDPGVNLDALLAMGNEGVPIPDYKDGVLVCVVIAAHIYCVVVALHVLLCPQILAERSI